MSEQKRPVIKKDNILHVALQNTRLDRRTHGNNLIWVDTFVRLFSKEFGHLFDNLWHTGHSPDENHFIDLIRR